IEHFERALSIHRLLVDAGDERLRAQRLSLLRRDRTDLAGRWHDPRTLGHARRAVLVEERDQRLTDGEIENGALDVERGVRPHGLGDGVHGLLIARRERAERVLHAVAELTEHTV